MLLQREIRRIPQGSELADAYALTGFILLDEHDDPAAAYQYLVTALRIGARPETAAQIRRELAVIEARQKRKIGRNRR